MQVYVAQFVEYDPDGYPTINSVAGVFYDQETLFNTFKDCYVTFNFDDCENLLNGIKRVVFFEEFEVKGEIEL